MAWIASFRALPFMATYGRRGGAQAAARSGDHYGHPSSEDPPHAPQKNESSEAKTSASAPFLGDRSGFPARPISAQRFSPRGSRTATRFRPSSCRIQEARPLSRGMRARAP